MVKCNKPQEIVVNNDRRIDEWTGAVEDLLDNDPPQVIIFIAPGRKGNSPIYDDIKHFCQSRCTIPTQVVLAETISRSKSLRNIMKNIMIQVNAKTGGAPWGFKSLPMVDRPTMVIGIDATHRVGRNNDSVLGFCATLDRNMCKFYTDSLVQENQPKIRPMDVYFKGLDKLFQTAFLEFKKVNGVVPERIIIYRDSQSEGQAENTRQKEVNSLRKAIGHLKDQEFWVNKDGNAFDPQFMFILANKSIEQRFFEARGKFVNPESGICIDSGITRDDRYEFYMVAHKGPTGLQGPVKYEVIAMENCNGDIDPADLYNLTYNLCFGFFNFQAAIKLPSPLKNANALCNQMALITKTRRDAIETPDEFKDKVYYI